jgi:hypothetical protein
MPPFEHSTCPTEVVEAPVDVVWALLTDPARWGDFYDVRVTAVHPPGPAVVDQIVRAGSGPRLLHLRLTFELRRIDPERHELAFDVRLPLGIRVHEELDCRPIGPDRCRVSYRCNFTFDAGWRGRAARLLLRREIERGPVDSIRRLKRAAEARVSE